jgi:MFS family permease
MIFAVAMMFIDQTIVSLAIPDLQKDLSLPATSTQWIVNGYLLSLAALFMLGGKLADVLGHRRMVVTGVIGFAVASALCGATPTGTLGEAWMIGWRVVQGAVAALLFPAALAIVVGAFPVEQRGRTLAAFFGITGALTAVGPLAGGYLAEWTWRAIFWVNVPVALIALVLIARSKPAQNRRPAPRRLRRRRTHHRRHGPPRARPPAGRHVGLDERGDHRVDRGGRAPARRLCGYELRQADPLVRVRLFSRRAFAADNAVLLLMSAVFLQYFFFASVYAQASLGDSATQAGIFLLVFFAGFATASQWGGRIVDRRGARPAIVLGSLIAAVGFYLWGSKVTGLDFSSQWPALVLAGAGLGLVLGPVSTDALNRAPDAGYGEVTGITQTVRNLGASLGLAIMGSLFVGAEAGPVEVAHSTHTVAWIMAGIMAATFVVAWAWLPKEPAVEMTPDGVAAQA